MTVTFEDLFSSAISGSWTTTDTTSKFSVTGGRLYVNGGLGTPAWGNPGLRYPASGTVTRSTLGALLAHHSKATGEVAHALGKGRDHAARVGMRTAAQELKVDVRP